MYKRQEHGYDKIPQIGHVEIGDHVEIGANSCVDRATMGAVSYTHLDVYKRQDLEGARDRPRWLRLPVADCSPSEI